MDNNQLKKLVTLQEEPMLAIFDELQNINDSLISLIKTIKEEKTETVLVNNIAEARSDFSVLDNNFSSLKESIEKVSSTMKSAPKANIDFSGIEKLLTKISEKEPRDIKELKELSHISETLNAILEVIQKTPQGNDEGIDIRPNIDQISIVLGILNENILSLSLPEFDYDRLSRVIKNLDIKVSASGTNMAPTEAKLDTLNSKDFATQTTLSSIDTKTPSLGNSTMSASVPVTLASDQTQITTINAVHKRAQEGRLFSGSCYNATLADNGTLEMLIQAGAQESHMTFWSDVSGDAIITFYEGTTFSAAGTTVSMPNHHRTSAKTFVGTVTHTPTLTAAGTQINGTDFIPGGTKGSGSGGTSQSFTEEFVLALNTNYLIRLTNISGGVGKADIHFACYQPNL